MEHGGSIIITVIIGAIIFGILIAVGGWWATLPQNDISQNPDLKYTKGPKEDPNIKYEEYEEESPKPNTSNNSKVNYPDPDAPTPVDTG